MEETIIAIIFWLSCYIYIYNIVSLFMIYFLKKEKINEEEFIMILCVMLGFAPIFSIYNTFILIATIFFKVIYFIYKKYGIIILDEYL